MLKILAGVLAGTLTALATSIGAHAQAQSNTGCDLAKADVEVAGIRLANGDSSRRVLGKDFRIVMTDPQSENPWLVIASRDNKQILRLRKHAGDVVDSYMEFEIKFGRDERRPQNLKMYEFVTGQGIKLGARKKSVVAKLGPCFKSTIDGKKETIRYEIKEKAEKNNYRSPLLKAANMPEYYAEYEFDRDRLVRFQFGHEPV
jgi:hypothetical protein